MQVKFFQQLLFDSGLGIVRAKEETIRQNHRRPPVLPQTVHDDAHKEVGGFRIRQIGGEIALNIGFFRAAVGRGSSISCQTCPRPYSPAPCASGCCHAECPARQYHAAAYS